MAQPQPTQQQIRGRSGTPGRSSRLASQSSNWTPQLGAIGSTGPASAPASASHPRTAGVLLPGWDPESGGVSTGVAGANSGNSNSSSHAAATAGFEGITTAAAPHGLGLPHASSMGVLASAISPAMVSPGLALATDRKLIPTRSATARAPAVVQQQQLQQQQQQSRSTSQPRSAGRGAPGSASWASATTSAGVVGAAHGPPSPRASLGAISQVAAAAPAGPGSTGPGQSPRATASPPAAAVIASNGNGVEGGGPPVAASSGSLSGGWSMRIGSALRPNMTRLGVSPPAAAEAYAAAAGAAAGVGSALGTSRPQTPPDVPGTAAVGAAGGLGFVQGGPRDVPLRPNSAAPLGPTGGGGGCPPLPHPASSSAAAAAASAVRPASARRPLSAHQDIATADGAAPRLTSRLSLTCISDVPASSSLADLSLGAGPSLPSLPGFAMNVRSPSATASGGAAAGAGGGGGSSVVATPRRGGSAFLVSLDGLPPGPSRLYEAITKQMEASDVGMGVAEEELPSGSEDGGWASAAGGGEAQPPPLLPQQLQPAQPPSWRGLLGPSLRTFPGDLQPGKPPLQLQLPLQPWPMQPRQHQQTSVMAAATATATVALAGGGAGSRQSSDANMQLGHLRAASLQEPSCIQPTQTATFSTPASAYNPLQPNIRGRQSWTGAPASSSAAPAAAGAAPGGALSPAASPVSTALRPASPPSLATPSSPSAGSSYPSAPPPTPAGMTYRFPALAFPPNATLPPHVQALLQQPFGAAVASSAPRDQATVAAAAVLAAAAGAVASVGVAAAVADLRNWFTGSARSGSLSHAEEAPGSPSGAAAPPPPPPASQRLHSGSAAAAAAAAAIAGRPYAVNKLRLNLGVVGPVTSSHRPSDAEFQTGAAAVSPPMPPHQAPPSTPTGVPSLSENAAGGGVAPGGLILPFTGAQRGTTGALMTHLLQQQQQEQHLSQNHQLLAQLQQQRAVQLQQQATALAQQHAATQQALFQQQLQQQQLQRRQQQQQQQLLHQQKQPLNKLVTLAEALAAAAEQELGGYFISASAVGPPLDWEGGSDGPGGSPRRAVLAAWRGGGSTGTVIGAGAESGMGEGGASASRPPTATRNERGGVAAGGATARLRAGGAGGGGGALRQQAWLEGSAALLAAASQHAKPQLWVQSGPRPVSEAVQWLARIAESAPSGWESDGWHQRPCSRSYLEGLRSGSGALEAALQQEELAAAAAAEQQRAAAAREAAAAATPPGIASRVQTWRPAVLRQRVRSAGPRRRRVTSSSSSSGSSSEDEEEGEEGGGESEDEEAARGRVGGPAAAAARSRPKPRPPPPRPRPPPAMVPKLRPPAPPRGRGRGDSAAGARAVVDDE